MTSTAIAGAPVIKKYQTAAAALLLALGLIYLVPFVERGWVPIDEGMIGQSAERVMTGARPHVDYEEPYPGTLSYFYAAVFGITGVDSAHLRWTIFGAALVSLGVLYAILRRYLEPLMAALATWAALVWTYPNYFSSLPSWWILLCALICVWGVIRYIETERLLFVVAAGGAAGLAATIKQTGLYLFPPLFMSLLTCTAAAHPSATRLKLEAILRVVVAAGALGSVILLTKTSLGSGELLYLVAPIAASCVAFSLRRTWSVTPAGMNWQAALVAGAAAAVPLAILIMPYVATGQLGAFIEGVFILPQRRLQFTTLPMRPATQIVAAGAALLWIFWSPRSLSATEYRVLGIVRWVIAIALPFLALRSHFIYTFIWEAVRGTAALLPIIALWLVASKRIEPTHDRRILFMASAMLAWTSLSQFPFAAPIYFCYVAPLALVAGIAAVHPARFPHRLGDGPALAAIVLYALLSMNRGYVWNVGWFHEVHDLSTPLDLPRAHLTVASYEADVFQRVVPLVRQHLGERGLVAGPDAPDIYFLTGQFSPSGRLFDFFSTDTSVSEAQQLAAWTAADVIVMFHGKRFSPPLSESLVSRLRDEFPKGESVPPFEVRWR